MSTKNTHHESSMLGKVAAVAGAAVAGVAVGAAAAVMADPKKRKAVVKKLNEVKDMAQEATADVVAQGQKAVDHVSGMAEDIKDRVTSQIEVTKKDLSDRLNEK